MTQPAQNVRYSQGTKDIGAAHDLPWEHPVPRNKFWDDLPFTVGRNFLSLFNPASEPPPPSFDDAETSALNRTEKLQLLLQLLCERLARKDAEAATSYQSFYDVDYTAWNKTWLAIAGIQHELGEIAQVVAQAVWMQGRREEGERLMDEVEGIIEGTRDDSPYAVYRDQQREMTREAGEKLRREDGRGDEV